MLDTFMMKLDYFVGILLQVSFITCLGYASHFMATLP